MKTRWIIPAIVSVVLTGCNSAYQFTSENQGKGLPGAEQNPPGGGGDPGGGGNPPTCIVNPISVQAPSSVINGETFTLRVNGAVGPQWTLTLGGQTLTYSGSEVQTSLATTGNWQGTVRGMNNCLQLETVPFAIQVRDDEIQIGMLINNNDVFTNSADVTLSLTYLNVDEVYITNTPNCVDGGQWLPVAASRAWTLSTLNNTALVYAKFRNARNETACISDEIIHDNEAPALAFARTPSNPTGNANTEFEFSVSDSGSGVSGLFCRVDGATFSSCATTQSFGVLADGSHTVEAYARDRAGNQSTTISYTWVIDATGPSVRITSAPAAASRVADAQFEFAATVGPSGLASLECALDSGTFAACTSPTSYNSLVDGDHLFRVRATDNTGRSALATYNWSIDTRTQVQPVTIIGSGRADILFVVDNSQSMFNELRDSIPYRFERFLEYLGDADYRIAFTTGDAQGSREFEEGRMTRILRSAVPGSGIALVPAVSMLSREMSNAGRNFLATMMRPEAICVETGTHLCPNAASSYQEGIHAASLAIVRPENSGFFRGDASLHVVVISDTDEASRAYILSGDRISPNLPVQNRPETLMATVAQRFPEKSFRFHGVVRPTTASTCNNSSGIDARTAPIYQSMIQQSGGQLVNICRDRDRSEVQQLATQIRSTGHRYQLRCVPTDENGDGHPDVQVSFSPAPASAIQTIVTGQTVRFSPEPPAGTTATLTYRCP